MHNTQLDCTSTLRVDRGHLGQGVNRVSSNGAKWRKTMKSFSLIYRVASQCFQNRYIRLTLAMLIHILNF